MMVQRNSSPLESVNYLGDFDTWRWNADAPEAKGIRH
jgi:hypothetical protein